MKIEGADIGRLITLEVPDADGEGTVSVTFTGWVGKDGEDGEFVGFTLDVDATFTVKAGQDVFEGIGGSWTNPNGTGGSAAKGISYVKICSADEPEPPPPPPEEPPPEEPPPEEPPPPECEHDCPPPPPPPPCCGDGTVGDGEQCDDGNDTNGDGCENDCTLTPPPPPPPPTDDCDDNHDGDTTDHGECDHVCVPGE